MKRRQEFKAIIFDWGGVLCTGGDYMAYSTFSKISKKNKIPKKCVNDFYIGKIEAKQFWNTLIKKLNITGISPKELTNAYINSYTIYPFMFRLVKKLCKTYKLGLLSNLPKIMKNHIVSKHKVNKYFDYLSFSCDNGYMKPNRKAFSSIMRKMKVSANRTIFVDDARINIGAANRMGFKTILFKSEKQCRSDLHKLGIKV